MIITSNHSTIKIPFSNLKHLHLDINEGLQNAFSRLLNEGWFIMGKELAAFENEFAAYIGVKHCVGVGNGLDALILILKALNIGQGDEVIVPSHTFIATWLAVTHVGAKPVPVMTDSTYTIDTNQISPAITEKTKAIIAVHLYGHPADMEALYSSIKGTSITLIEDAAQAHGTIYKDKRAGNLAMAAGFSFYPGKNLGALGDGGCVTTNNDYLATRIRMLRNYGSEEKYVHKVAGYNSRLDEIQAAFLRIKLPLLDRWNDRRREIASTYLHELSGIKNLTLPLLATLGKHVYHQFVIRTSARDALAKHLAIHGIQTLVHYPIANHLQGPYQDHYNTQDFLSYHALTTEILSLPICPTLEDAQISYICEKIKDFNFN